MHLFPSLSVRPLEALAVALLSPIFAHTLPSAPGETPTLNRIVAGEIFIGDDPDEISDELAHELAGATPDFSGAVALLLKGASKAKSPRSAEDLINFCYELRELNMIAEDPDTDDVALDLERTRVLWKTLIDDKRHYGMLASAGVPYTVGDVTSEILEHLATPYDDEESMEAVWSMRSTLGGRCVGWFQRRARARIAGEKLPPFPDARSVNREARDLLRADFTKLGRDARPGWLAARSPDEILALKEMAAKDADLGRGLVGPANTIFSNSVMTKNRSAVASDWKPESTAFDKAFLEEIVGRASNLAKAGEYHRFSILRGAGFTGVEVLQEPQEIERLVDVEDAYVLGILRNLGLYRHFCEGVLLVHMQFHDHGRAGDDDHGEAVLIWPAGIKPDPKGILKEWIEDSVSSEDDQKEFVDLIMKTFHDPANAGKMISLELWCFPTAGE